MERATYFIAAIVLGLLVGIFSAVQAMGSFGLQPVEKNSKWSEWQLSGSDSKLVYSLGHFLSSGQLPPPKLAHSFIRTTDDSGNGLSRDCVYLVEGKITPARWWTMSVSQTGGSSSHSVLSAGEAIVDRDDNLSVTISAHPVPGNWLQAEDRSISIEYIINEAPNGELIQLPSVTKKSC